MTSFKIEGKTHFKDEAQAFTFSWREMSRKLRRSFGDTEINKKSDDVASKLKDNANTVYRLKDLLQAEYLYRRALCLAVPNSVMYGKVLANLSAIKLEQKQYKTCIDLIHAHMKTANVESFAKMYVREIRAWVKNGDMAGAKQVLKRLNKYLQTSKHSNLEKEKFLLEAQQTLNLPPDENIDDEENNVLLVPNMDMNPNFLNASENAELKYNQQFGRHVFAKNKIKKGDAVLVDYPYASYGISQCANCFKPNIVPYPCLKCFIFVYCSENCREYDRKTIHKWECKLCQMKLVEEIKDFAMLGLRIFLKGLLVTNSEEIPDIEESLSFGNADNNYPHVQKLFADFGLYAGNSMELVPSVVSTCMLMAYLVDHTNLLSWIKERKVFGDVHRDVDLQHIIGKQLLRLNIMCYYNAYIHTTLNEINFILHPSYSLFNGSCAPNTSKYVSGANLVMVASEDIEAGDQIFTSYIIINQMKSTEQRISHLQERYGYTCECKLCMEVYNSHGIVPCPKCDDYGSPNLEKQQLVCDGCGHIFPVEITLKHKNIVDSYNLFRSTGNTEYIYCAIKIIEDVKLNPKCPPFVDCYSFLIKHEISTGNLEQAVQHLDKIGNLQSNIVLPHFLGIYKAIEEYTKKIYQAQTRFNIQFKRNVLEDLLRFLTDLRGNLQVRFPKKIALKALDDLMQFYGIHLSIAKLRESVTWDKA